MQGRRMTGVLLPLFSLRRERDAGIGDLIALEEWIDWAAEHGVGFFQLLPVNETGDDDAPSPYSSVSSIALEPLYLSLERVPGVPSPLPEQAAGLPPLQYPAGADLVDYPRVRAYKRAVLRAAWKNFCKEEQYETLRTEFAAWVERECSWLEDYADFRVLSIAFNTTAWWTWSIRDVNEARRFVAQDEQASRQKRYRQWLQWLCAREWAMVRRHADARGVMLMGDVPIGISVASADVFFRRHLFDMEWSGGAPAEGNFADDPFTAKWGQNWGIPLYRWDVMQRDGMAWWVQRVRKLTEIFGMYRIDHILGFYRIYAFPWMPDRNAEFLNLSPDEAAARCGGRRPGFRPRPDDSPEQRKANLMQGDTLLGTILQATPGPIVIGEDLGCVPDYVRPDLSRLRIAGFKIPHWECDALGHIIRGDTYNPCSFTTFATHDFPPLCVDWQEWCSRVEYGRRVAHDLSCPLDNALRDTLRIARDCAATLCRLGDYAGLSGEESLVPWSPSIKTALYRALLMSRANYAALLWTELFDIPVRLNLPGTQGGTNWRPRIPFTAAQAAARPQSGWLLNLSRMAKRTDPRGSTKYEVAEPGSGGYGGRGVRFFISYLVLPFRLSFHDKANVHQWVLNFPGRWRVAVLSRGDKGGRLVADMKRIQTAVVGASGYTGQELLRILLLHPGVEIVSATSRQYAGKELQEVFTRFREIPGAELKFSGAEVEGIVQSGAEAAFLALPHGVSMEYGRALVDAGIRVVDLSADFRLHDPDVYKEYYGKDHTAAALLKETVYGMPEWHREEIRKARIVGSPGCYPTSILLPLIPLVRAGLTEAEGIVANSCSGVSGAGRKADVVYHFCECNESMRAYGVPRHRHLSEIEQELSAAAGRPLRITFIPHLMPVNTGILTTISAPLKAGVGLRELGACYTQAYAGEPFVRLLGAGVPADTKNVTHTNFADIGWAIDERTGRVILMCAEDNVVKGAGGQGVHALNVMFGMPETTGLLLL